MTAPLGEHAPPALAERSEAPSDPDSAAPLPATAGPEPPPPPPKPAPTPPAATSKNGASSQALSLPQGAAKVDGLGDSFSVQASTGVLTYRIPFALPRARGGAQASLGLAYASSRGNGAAGIGWDVPVPFIARQTDRGPARYDDPVIGGAWQPTQDRFVFGGGQELVPICRVSAALECAGALPDEAMPVWASGWQYFRARVEGAFQRFFWSPDHRTWVVQDKSGVAFELGVPLDTPGYLDALETHPQIPDRIFRWNIVRQYDAQRDASGRPVNVVAYRYLQSGGLAHLSDVFDTPPRIGAGTAPTSEYAHHVHLAYELRPDALSSYRRGWKTVRDLRLTRVDVTSKPFVGGSEASRELLRRYHLGYEPGLVTSLLDAVTLEGRCAVAVTEDAGELLPSSSGCPTLPPASFDYEHVQPFHADGSPAEPDLPGHEGFDDRRIAIAQSPKYSLDGHDTDLFDVDADGLPDVLVTLPAFFQGKHGVFFNGGGGVANAFTAGTIGVAGVLGDDAGSLALGNPNVVPQDLDGDGVVDLVHMPKVKTYAAYGPRRLLGAWTWQGREITTASQQSPKIDWTGKSGELAVMDVDGDGLVDVVHTGATQVETFLSLGRYPGGDGQFGHATWTGPSTAAISNEPLTACVPWSATPIHFSDPDVRIADMNGDGYPDIVRVRTGDIRYWPGRGDGFFGTGDPTTCPGGSFGANRYVAMSSSPHFSQLVGRPRLDDVDGDGLADLVQVRATAVDVWLNEGGAGWTVDRHIVEDTPFSSPTTNRVRLVDFDGSGTRDVLWGNGLDYEYVDLLGGARPWLLTRAANGLGRTTRIEYATSTQQMLAAAASGEAWQSSSPVVAHLVAKVVEEDHLDLVGRPPGALTTEYTYRDPAFDGRQRELRGFREVRARHLGDVYGPTELSTSRFLLGECKDETPANGVDECAIDERWRDNPREALKGTAVESRSEDESGVALSTTHATVRLRTLYQGLDGRVVRHAFVTATDVYRYDTAVFVGAPSTVALAEVELEPALGAVTVEPPPTVLLTSASGRVRTRTGGTVDAFGNAVEQLSLGCIEGCPSVDEKISSVATPGRRPDDPTGWMWRTVESYVVGSSAPASKRGRTLVAYDLAGHPVTSQAELTGTLPLDRHHEDPSQLVAPPPPMASGDGWIDLGTRLYDELGNLSSEQGPLGRCAERAYDSTYAELVVVDTTFVGSLAGSCGETALTRVAGYDRALQAPTSLIDARGEVGIAAYDGFGRVTKVFVPDPAVVGLPSAVPSLQVDYLLPADAAVEPVTRVRVRSQDGPSASSPQFHETWTYLDGLGRELATLDEADPTAGDGGAWIARGVVERAAKGVVARSYLPWFVDDDPADLDLSLPAPTAYTAQAYDAFGRTTNRWALDGAPVLAQAYHALSVDAWDAGDLEPNGPHTGTFASTRLDGHGRVAVQTERIRVGGVLEARETRTDYLPTGEPRVVTRVRVGGPDTPVVRWLRYDSLGRLVLNAEPSTTKGFDPDPSTDAGSLLAWRYAYDDLGEIVGTSDARGCGVNYHYDAGGRPTGDDYSPCLSSQPEYTEPDLVAGAGLESRTRYDAADPDAPTALGADPTLYKGRLASSSDRASFTVPRYDGRGRVTGIARRIARPGVPGDLSAGSYAPRWYLRQTSFDGADRPTTESTGAAVPELMGLDGRSLVTTAWSARGTPTQVGGNYGALIASVERDADGLVSHVVRGDLAATTTSRTYDARRRLHTAQVYRSTPPAWTAPPPTYQPSPAPGSTTSFQLLLEDSEILYDIADNPIELRDWREAAEWPAGAKPVTRHVAYDDLYRVTQVEHIHAGGADAWVSPFDAENAGDADPRRSKPSPHVAFDGRTTLQTFAYDWLGNTVATEDDADGFYDRSLGAVTNATYRLVAASNETLSAPSPNRQGHLTADYDFAGNLTSLAVSRHGPCLPAGAACDQRFVYDWDEVGRLVRARRWDLADAGAATDPVPQTPAAADLRYGYDAGGERVLKTAVDEEGHERHTAYVFDSLELRRAPWIDDLNDPDASDYEASKWTEVVYLVGAGQRLARLHYDDDAPTYAGEALHVLLEMEDHLGSSSIVIDKATGELTERSTYLAYGGADSDYRPGRWNAFREDYRFTGKEEDVEVGLAYFGARFYAPTLGRWLSPDPLAVHALGADLNVYAYVHGRVLAAVDPVGLDGEDDTAQESFVDGTPGNSAAGSQTSQAPIAEPSPSLQTATLQAEVAGRSPFDPPTPTERASVPGSHEAAEAIKDDLSRQITHDNEVWEAAEPQRKQAGHFYGRGLSSPAEDERMWKVASGEGGAPPIGYGYWGPRAETGHTYGTRDALDYAGWAYTGRALVTAKDMSWSGVRSRLGQELSLPPRTQVHHWLIPQGGTGRVTLRGLLGEQWGRYVPEFLRNGRWNLMVPPLEARGAQSVWWHNALHGLRSPFVTGPGGQAGRLGLTQRLWYGSPTWAKVVVAGAPAAAGGLAYASEP